MDLRLKDKVAFICGGASPTGREISANFVKEGAKLFLTDIMIDQGKELADELISKGGDVLFAKMDVSGYQEVASTVKQAEAHFGRVDILVFVTGYAIPGKFVESGLESWKKQVDVNLYGMLNVTHALLPGMIERKYGKVVSLMGDSSRIGENNLSVLAAARAGQIGLIKSLAKEVGRFNITLNGVSLGILDTSHHKPGFIEKNREKLVRPYPLGRLGMPEDVAPMVLLLCSDRSSWITGQIISVNGGFAMV
jgi:2-hydroxycyclohexanecarboxyl-CoA dehydrogenase